MENQFNPLVIGTSLVSSWLVSFAYKHPAIKWVNKDTVPLISAVLQSGVTALTLWLSGDLTATSTQDLVHSVLVLSYHAFCASGLGVAFAEWQKPRVPEDPITHS